MQSLLSPSESHAFQSFLSSMDCPEDTLSASEWAMYTSTAPIQSSNLDDPLHESEPQNPEHREALSKATKDLMSLDADHRWDAGDVMMGQHSGMPPQQHFNMHGQQMGHCDQQQGLQQHQQHQQHLTHQQQVLQHHQRQQQQRHNSLSTGHEPFPFLHGKPQQKSQQINSQYPQYMQHQQHPHLAVPPLNTINSHDSSSSATPTSPHSPYGFQQHNSGPMHHQQQQSLPPQRQRDISPASRSVSRSKRMPSSQSAPSASTSRSPALKPSASSPNPNTHPSSSSHFNGHGHPTTNGTSKRAPSSASPTTGSTTSTLSSGPASKQTLLSPSQKKANHIQSEQKRRANIRRGYEALCETVPALREAIREEEEAEKNAAVGRGGRGPAVNGAGKKKGRGKKGAGVNGAGKESQESEKDRIDGRAGPRSENVVLSKTIDHIQSLLADRSSLLARLHRARSSLPPGHPALTPLAPDPLWEREWKGGDGRLGDEDLDGEGGSDEDGE